MTLTSLHSHRCDDPNYVSASKDVQSISQSPNAALSATPVATSTNFAPPTHRFSILAFSLLSLITQAPTSKSCPPPEPQPLLTVLPLQHRRYPRQLRVVGRICHFYDCSAPQVPIFFRLSSPSTYLLCTRLVAPVLQGFQKVTTTSRVCISTYGRSSTTICVSAPEDRGSRLFGYSY